MNNLKEEVKGNALMAVGLILFILVAIAFVVFWPFAIIWALNTVFVTLSIPYTFWTWLGVVILQMSTFGGVSANIANLQRAVTKKFN